VRPPCCSTVVRLTLSPSLRSSSIVWASPNTHTLRTPRACPPCSAQCAARLRMPPSGCSALLRTAAQLQCAAPARAEQRLLSLLLAHAAPVAGAGGGRARLSGPAAPRCLSALPCAHGALALAPRGFAGSAAAHAPPPRVSEPPPPSARFPSPSAAPAVPSDHEVTVKAFYVGAPQRLAQTPSHDTLTSPSFGSQRSASTWARWRACTTATRAVSTETA